MDRLDLERYYSRGDVYFPMIVININGQYLPEMIVQEVRRMIGDGTIRQPWWWERNCYFTGNHVRSFLDRLFLSTDYYVTFAMADDMDETGIWKASLNGVGYIHSRETEDRVVWEDIGVQLDDRSDQKNEQSFVHLPFRFEFDREQYYQEFARFITIQGWMVKEEEADKIPRELSAQLQSRMVYKRDGGYFYSAGKWYRCYGGEKEKAYYGVID